VLAGNFETTFKIIHVPCSELRHHILPTTQTFRKWEEVLGTGWSWLRIGTGGGHL